MDQLVDIAYDVSDLQATQFNAAIAQLKNTAIDLKTAATVLQFGLQFKDALSGFHSLTQKFFKSRNTDDGNATLLKLNIMQAVIEDIALRLPSGDVLTPIRQAATRYRMIMTAPGVLNVRDLRADTDTVQRVGNALFDSLSTGMIDALGNLDEARDVAVKAATARQLAQQIILVNQQTTMAEGDFLRDGNDDAADRMLVGTVRMQALVEMLAHNISDPAVQKNLDYLRLRVVECNANFKSIVAAQRAQAILLSQIHASMNDMLKYVERIN